MFFIGKERKKELMYHIELLPYCRETQFLFPPRKSLVRTKKKVCIIIISSFCVCKGRLKMFRLLCMQTLRISKKLKSVYFACLEPLYYSIFNIFIIIKFSYYLEDIMTWMVCVKLIFIFNLLSSFKYFFE